MNRVNHILNNDKYKELVHIIKSHEAQREFCRHDISHFLDVARIAYIQVLERRMDVDKEVIYATALLHDIGRAEQYRNGAPHNEAGLILAKEILYEACFDDREIAIILNAIEGHRNISGESDNFNKIFASSDKLSRNCFNCEAIESCKWSREKRNFKIKY